MDRKSILVFNFDLREDKSSGLTVNDAMEDMMPKTYKNLYPKICAFENLYAAHRKARRGGVPAGAYATDRR